MNNREGKGISVKHLEVFHAHESEDLQNAYMLYTDGDRYDMYRYDSYHIRSLTGIRLWQEACHSFFMI